MEFPNGGIVSSEYTPSAPEYIVPARVVTRWQRAIRDRLAERESTEALDYLFEPRD